MKTRYDLIIDEYEDLTDTKEYQRIAFLIDDYLRDCIDDDLVTGDSSQEIQDSFWRLINEKMQDYLCGVSSDGLISIYGFEYETDDRIVWKWNDEKEFHKSIIKENSNFKVGELVYNLDEIMRI